MERIENSKPGDFLPSENELCQQFNVSRITIQRAIKDLLEKELIVRKKGKGTFVAPSVLNRTSAAKTIKIIFPSGGDPEDDFLFPIIRGLIDHFQHSQFHFVLSPWKSSQKKIERFSDFSGIFWIAPDEKDFHTIEEISLNGVPLIVINRVMKTPFINFVSTDHYKAGLTGAEYLVSRGHRSIVFVGLIKGNTCSYHMYEGYRAALEKAGMRTSSPLIISACLNSKMKIGKGFHKKLNRVIEKHCPDGLFVAGELFLPDVLESLERKNLIPGRDVDIVLSDEVPDGAPYKENIIGLIQPLSEIGDIAARCMKQILNGEKKRIRVQIPPVLRKV